MCPVAISSLSVEQPLLRSATSRPARLSLKPRLARFDADDPSMTIEALVSVLERDGGVIVENIITPSLAAQIKSELKPYLDTDRLDRSGFFPRTTQRATGLLARSRGCVDIAMNQTLIGVANQILSSTYTYWNGQVQETVTSKPIISSTVAFRVNPGGLQQALHRDDSDYHTRNCDMPMVTPSERFNKCISIAHGIADAQQMMGCVTALTRTTKENGATVCIPGSHLWGPERCPLNEEVVPAELEPGSAFLFLGNLYHAGGGNVTTDQARETVGIFLCKPYYRPAENQFLMVPPEKARHLPTQVQRLLGYGICLPSLGFVDYQDPMRVLFGIEDDETVNM